MSIKVATYKKTRPNEMYACTVSEAQAWAEGLADLRIDFGKQRTFPVDSGALNRPKISGIIVASLWMDRQLKPALAFYPLPVAKFPEKALRSFREQVLPEWRQWLEEQLELGDDRAFRAEVLLAEWGGNQFKSHRLRYL
ncbi:MAG TPA: hypothetical protein PLC07_10545 [Bacillota bacterium]|nr:hypothetical protein [Bacillota bacterium]HPT87924.1 hypothetical protein [Bacillota bacterium]